MPGRLQTVVIFLVLVGTGATLAAGTSAGTPPWSVTSRSSCALPEGCSLVRAGLRLESASGEIVDRIETVLGDSGIAVTRREVDIDAGSSLFLVPWFAGCDGETVEEQAVEIGPLPATHRPRLLLVTDDRATGDCRLVTVGLTFEIEAGEILRVHETRDGELAFTNTGQDILRRCGGPTRVRLAGEGDGTRARRLDAFVWPEHRPEIAPGETLLFPRDPGALAGAAGDAREAADRRIELPVSSSGWTRRYGPADERPTGGAAACDLLTVPWPSGSGNDTGAE